MDKPDILSAKLAIFDVDGTITEIKPELKACNPRMVTPNSFDEQQPISGVVEGLARIKAAGIPIALATNRGGVAFGYNTLEEAQALAQEAADMCGIPDAKVYICPYHAKASGPRANLEFTRESDCRKPNPGMLIQALTHFDVSPEEAFFVGDKDVDQQAAESAEVAFFWADEFFGLVK